MIMVPDNCLSRISSCVSLRRVDISFYAQGVPRIPTSFRSLTEDNDTGSSTEPSDDLCSEVVNHYRFVKSSIQHRLN